MLIMFDFNQRAKIHCVKLFHKNKNEIHKNKNEIHKNKHEILKIKIIHKNKHEIHKNENEIHKKRTLGKKPGQTPEYINL